jgi:polyribonucleotide nucleotidyltransferase
MKKRCTPPVKSAEVRFVKREGRPSEDAILTARLIDRPIRPLFPKGFMLMRSRELPLFTAWILTLKPDTIGMIAVSTALMLTGAPFEGPVGGVRIALVDGELIAYPTKEQLLKSKLDLTVAGTEDAIMMVEAGADEVDEETMVKALQMAHEAIQPVIALAERACREDGCS